MKQPETKPPSQLSPAVIVVMGVAGAGKTTVGRALAEQIGFKFADADDFHSTANKQKMSDGTPLTDEDRAPWLRSMRHAIEQWIGCAQHYVLACSALKHSYRTLLAVDPAVQFVFLKAPVSLVAARLSQRSQHYMKTNMVESQFAALEEPDAHEAIVVDASDSCDRIVDQIRLRLHL